MVERKEDKQLDTNRKIDRQMAREIYRTKDRKAGRHLEKQKDRQRDG